jgi:hypothetical protein
MGNTAKMDETFLFIFELIESLQKDVEKNTG